MSEGFKGMQWEYNKTNFDRNLAVVIGIDRYNSDRIHNLSTPVSDARALADLLETEYEYKPENVIRLFDEDATLTELQTLLNDTLPNRLKPTKGDRLIFYFAGHGIPRNSKDGPEGYLVPQDADWQKEDSFLPMSKVYEALSKLECHHLLVILDCCFAGTFRWAGRRKMIPILETVRREHYDRFIRYPAWQVMTSAAHDQEALDVAKLAEDKRGAVPGEMHSPFALALLEGLRENKADVIPDGVITAHELYLYLEQQVSKLSGERQKPGIYPMRLEYDRGEFVFTKPGFTSEQLKPAPLLNESNNPYRGLASFDEKHARFFFGRKILVEELQHRLSQPHRSLTVVLGASGSGKSSLVKAGLIPDLRHESNPEVFALNLIKACILTEAILAAFPQFPLKLLPIYYVQQWYILDPMRPDRSPFTALARAILPIDKPELIEQLSQVSFLDEVFKPKDESGQDKSDESTDAAFIKLAESWNTATPEAKLLLVEDYFKQLLALCRNPQEKEQLSQLYQAIFEQLESLSNRLQNELQHLTSVIRKWSETHPNAKLLLTIDQFEELITMSQESQTETHGGDKQESDSPNETVGDRAAESQPWLPFLQVLRGAIVECSQQLHIVLTLRSDFEPRFLSSPLSAYWKDARFPVRAMNLDELRQAIEGPALKQALYFEPPELVGKLIDEVGQMPGALPLLSFTLSELYIKLHDHWVKDNESDRALRIKDYEELGGVAGALTRRATQEYDRLIEDKDLEDEYRGGFGKQEGKAYQATMKRVILRMVAIEGGGVARRRVPESELKYLSPEHDDRRDEDDRVVEVIKRLVQARLLVKGQETGEAYIEPAHDFLVRGWDKLQKWIKENQEDLALQQRLTPAANDWAIGKGGLWTREVERLARLEKLLDSPDFCWLNSLETKFARNSIQTRQDELKLTEERRQAALARQLSAQAELVRNQNVRLLPLSILLGLESLKRFPSLEADRFLRRGLSLTPRYTNPILHNSSVRVLAFSPDGKYIATVSKDIALDSEGEYISNSDNFTQKICVLEVATGKPVHCISRRSSRVISEEYQGIRGIVFSPPDGKYIATISIEEITQVQVWELATGEEVACISLGYSVSDSVLESKDILIPDYRRNEVQSIAFSPDGKYLAIVGEDTTQKPEHWKSTKTLSDGKSYTARIMQSRNAKQVRVWELARNQETAVWTQTSLVDAIAFNVDKESFYVAGSSPHDSTQIKIWEAATGQVIASIPHDNSASVISFSPNGRYLATMTSANDRLIQVWEVSNSREVTRIYCSDTPITVAFSLDGKYVVTVSGCQVTNEYIAQAWEINAISEPKAGNSTLEIACIPYSADLVSGRAAAISQYGKYLATASSIDAWVWEIKKNEAVATVPLESQVNLIAFSTDGNYLITAGINTGSNQKIHLWQTATCNLVATLPQPDDLQAIVPSYDGKLLALAVGQESSCIQIWSISEQNQIDNLPLNKKVTNLAFNRDKKCFCLCFTTAVDESEQTLDEQAANELNFEDSSYDFLLQEAFGRGAYDFLLQTATKTSQNPVGLQVCEAATWQEIANIPHVSGMWNPVAISSDGQYVATAKVDETEESVELQVWDVATAQKIESLRPRNLMPLRAIAISPKGTHLATLAVDTNAQVQVWEIVSGKEIARIEAEGLVIAIALEQRYLATVSQSFQLGNVVMQVWPWHPEALIHETCKRLTRNLTSEEWQQYLPDDPYRQTCLILPNRVMQSRPLT